MWFSEGGEKGRARLGQWVRFLGLKGQTVVQRDGEITQRLLDLYRKNMICDNNKYRNLKVVKVELKGGRVHGQQSVHSIVCEPKVPKFIKQSQLRFWHSKIYVNHFHLV